MFTAKMDLNMEGPLEIASKIWSFIFKSVLYRVRAIDVSATCQIQYYYSQTKKTFPKNRENEADANTLTKSIKGFDEVCK